MSSRSRRDEHPAFQSRLRLYYLGSMSKGRVAFAHSDHYWGCRGYMGAGRECWWCCNVQQTGLSQLPAMADKLAAGVVLKARASVDGGDIYEGAGKHFELCSWCRWSSSSGLYVCLKKRFVDTAVDAYGHVSVWLWTGLPNAAAVRWLLFVHTPAHTHRGQFMAWHRLLVLSHSTDAPLYLNYTMGKDEVNDLPALPSILRIRQSTFSELKHGNTSASHSQTADALQQRGNFIKSQTAQSPLMVKEHSLGVCTLNLQQKATE